MKVCPNCQEKISDDAVFCPSCGAKIPDPQPEPIPDPAPNPQPEPTVAPQPAPYPPQQQVMLVHPPYGKSIASLILGILSIPFDCGFGFGLILGIIGVILGVSGRKSTSRFPNARDGYSIAGIICSIIGILFGILSTLYYVVVILFWL